MNKRFELLVLVALLAMSSMVAYDYFNNVELAQIDAVMQSYFNDIGGYATAPTQWRVLSPFIMKVFVDTLSAVVPFKTAFTVVYASWCFGCIFMLAVMMYSWLSRLFKPEHALIGVMLMLGTMPIALRDHFYAPYSLLEPVLFTIACILIADGRDWLVLPLVIVATLNRETGALIAVLYGAAHVNQVLFGTKRERLNVLLYSAVLVAAATITYVTIRLVRGPAWDCVGGIAGVWGINTMTMNLYHSAINLTMFAGAIAVMAAFGIGRAPALCRRMALLVPVFATMIAVWGVWYEVRMLMPLYPLMLPLAVSAMGQPKQVAH